MRRRTVSLMIPMLILGVAHGARSQDAAIVRDTRPALTVTGNGEETATPDRAIIRLGAEARADTGAKAQSLVNEVVQEAIQQIKALGIEERRIQTSGISLFPYFERRNLPQNQKPEAPRVLTYQASNIIQVEVTNLSLVGRVMDAAIKSGVNRVESVSFDLQNDLPIRTRALQQAVTEAQTKATAMANALGVRLVQVSEVSEGGINVISPIPRVGAMAAQAEAANTPAQPGEIRIQASVTLRYHIAPK